MKRSLILLLTPLILLFLIVPIKADFSQENATLWLDTKISPQTTSPDEFLISLLALESNNIDTTTRLNTFLQLNQNQECFPKSNCRLRDTSLSLFALKKLNENSPEIIEWAEKQEKTAQSSGDWLVQIISKGDGICKIKHEDKTINAHVNKTRDQIKIGDKLVDWINLKEELNFKIDEIKEEVEVDCSDVGGSTIISLLRKVNVQGVSEEFHIVQQESKSKTTLEIKDVCYSQSSSCDKENTFLMSWALNTAEENINTLPYLRDNVNSDLEYALLYDITKEEKYKDILLERQDEARFWKNNNNPDVFTTSVVLYALSDDTNNQLQEAVTWLKKKQKQDNSINSNVFETASVIYFALEGQDISISRGGGSGRYCGDNVVSPELGEVCDGTSDTKAEGALQDCQNLCTSSCECRQIECRVDDDCIPPKVCNTKTNSCYSPSDTISCQSDDDCPLNNKCDIVLGICQFKPSGCNSDFDCQDNEICEQGSCILKPVEDEDKCGDGVCQSDESEKLCPSDCISLVDLKEEDSGSLWWLWVIIILLIIAGGAYFFYSKYVKVQPSEQEEFFIGSKRKKGRGDEGSYNPAEYPMPVQDKELEGQIDKSIEEAQELLKRRR